MTDLLHYMLRPTMPLPNEMLDAVGADRDLTWARLTDSERDHLWKLFPPVVAVATLRTSHFEFAAIDATAQGARFAIQLAWKTHADEYAFEGADLDYPVVEETDVIVGPIGTTWRDGALYPKGDN
jgi:hypothetical protein